MTTAYWLSGSRERTAQQNPSHLPKEKIPAATQYGSTARRLLGLSTSPMSYMADVLELPVHDPGTDVTWAKAMPRTVAGNGNLPADRKPDSRYAELRSTSFRGEFPVGDPQRIDPAKLDLALEPVFRGIDSRIVQRLREEAETAEARRQLVETAGIDDPELIEELTRLGVTAYGLVALRLVPLVLVAWAEGFVDPAERQSIMQEARRFGVREGSVAEALLDYWIRTRPSRDLLDAWKRLVQLELHRLSPSARKHFIKLTKEQMERVAKASGGIAGIGKISKAERRMIEGLLYIMQKASTA